jgi:hypothetical protein
MRKKPFVNATLRIDEDQHRRLMKAAKGHGTTLNAEIKWLIDRGLEQGEKRSQAALIDDLAAATAEFLAEMGPIRKLQDALVAAVLDSDFYKARELALELRRHRSGDRRTAGGAS